MTYFYVANFYDVEIIRNKKVLNKLLSISRLGVCQDMTYLEARNIVLVNKTAIFLILLAFVRVVIDFFSGNFFNLFFSVTMCVIPFFALFFNKINKSVLSSCLLAILISVFLASKRIVYGVNSGTEFGFLLLAIFIVLLFEDNKFKRNGILLVVLCYVASALYETQYGSFHSLPSNNGVFYFYFFATSSLSIWVFHELSSDNLKYSEKQHQLLKDLEKQKEEIKGHNAKLEHINKNLEKFAYQTSHDIKAPLKNINSFIGLMSKSVEKHNDPKLNQYVNIIEQNSKGLHNLVEEILAFAKMEVGKIQKSNVNLQEVIQEVKTNLHLLLDSKSARIETGLLSNIYANHSLMIILFQNLIENGLKYNESKNPVIKITQKYTEDKKIRIAIEDNGIGISPEYKEKIFEMFVRLDTGNKFTGTGIGLSTCKNIAQQLDGDLTFEANPTGGTRFILTFPQSIMIPKKVKVTLRNQSIKVGVNS